MKFIAPLTALALLSLVPVSARAVNFTSGFSDPTSLTVTTAGNFNTINGTNVDTLSASDGWAFLCVGVPVCADMGGTGGNYQGVLQSNILLPEGSYLLSFYLTGSDRGVTASTLVTFGNYDETFTLTSGDITDGLVTNAPVTVGPGGSYITFTYESGAYNIGDVLQSVTAIDPPASTPEPSSLVLLGSGLVAGARLLARRRNR
jgi:PEP-CTERM motif